MTGNNTGGIGQGSPQWLEFQYGSYTSDVDRTDPSDTGTRYTTTVTASGNTDNLNLGGLTNPNNPQLITPRYIPGTQMIDMAGLMRLARQAQQASESMVTIRIEIEPSDYNPVADPAINAKAAELGVPPGVLQKLLQAQANSYVMQQLDKLPANVADQLKFALAYPDAANNLSPELKQLLKQIQSDATSGQASQYQFPADWKGVPAEQALFADEVNANADVAFDKALTGVGIANGLSSQELMQLTSMHYLPEARANGDPRLVQLLEQAEANAKQAVQTRYGAPDFTPAPSTDYYTAVLNGAFADAFNTAIATQKPSLSAAQQAQVNAFASIYLANPKDPSIPDDIRAILEKVNAAAVSSVQTKYSLPADWAPSVTSLNPAGLDPIARNMANNAMNAAKEMVKQAVDVLAFMQPGAAKDSYMSFLQHISTKLNELQESIYGMQAAQVSTSSKISQLKFSMAKDALDAQMKSIQETRRQEDSKKSSGFWGKFMKAFNDVIGQVVMAVLGAATCGIFGLAAAILLMAKPDLFNKMFEGINSVCISALGPTSGAALASVVSTFTAVVVSGGNPMMGLQLVTDNSKAVENMVGAFGGSEAAKTIAKAAIMAIGQLAIGIALAVISGGAGSGMAMSSLFSMVNMTAETVATVQKVATVVSMVMQAVMFASSVTEGVVNYQNAMIDKAIIALKAALDKTQEQIEALITQLKQLVDLLMNAISKNPDMLLSINTFRSKMFTDAGNVTSELMG